MVKEYWTAEEAAAYLRYRAETLRNLARLGRIPAVRLIEGGEWRFDPDEIAAWAEGHRQTVLVLSRTEAARIKRVPQNCIFYRPGEAPEREGRHADIGYVYGPRKEIEKLKRQVGGHIITAVPKDESEP
jgi:excisionase family DNA binding protein